MSTLNGLKISTNEQRVDKKRWDDNYDNINWGRKDETVDGPDKRKRSK